MIKLILCSYLKAAIDADRYWDKYIAENDTVLARTFHGLFKNTVVCSVCQYPSVTFEPFMYLPVPLPDASLKQLEVTFVAGRSDGATATSLLLDLTQADNVGSMKLKLVQMLRAEQLLTEGESDDEICTRLQAVRA